MIWAFAAGCLLVLSAVLFGILRARYRAEALGMEMIKLWRKSWVPVTILIDEENFLGEEVPRLREAVKSAARFWNEQTGLKLFAPAGELGYGAVVPLMRHNPLTMESHDNAVAYASLTLGPEGALARAVIYMDEWENLPSSTLARALKHELGHCLGLAHDENELSVMYGKVSQRIYCVSPADKKFLLETYS